MSDLNYNLIENHYRGTTWGGVTFGITEQLVENGPFTPVNLTGYSVLMQLRLSENDIVAYEFSTSAGTVTIPAPLSGNITVPSQKVDIAPAIYVFDIRLTDSAGIVTVPIRDKWEITGNISRTS